MSFHSWVFPCGVINYRGAVITGCDRRGLVKASEGGKSEKGEREREYESGGVVVFCDSPPRRSGGVALKMNLCAVIRERKSIYATLD